MKLVRHVGDIGAPERPRVLAEGEFDGLHLGHQRVLAAVVARGHEIAGQPTVLLHRVGRAITRLTDLRDQLERLDATGVDLVVLTHPQEAALAVRRVRPSVYVTASATAAVARAVMETVAPVLVDDQPITAAAIRGALAAGDLDRARVLLGRDPGVSG